jgi:hypothetical protein
MGKSAPMSSGDLTARGDGRTSARTADPPPDAVARAEEGPVRLSLVDLRSGEPDPSAAAPRAELRIPAEPRSLRLARLVVAGVAAELGFTVDQVEDVRVAVDEACGAVLAHDAGGDGRTLLLAVDVVTGDGPCVLRVSTWSDPAGSPVVDAVPALLLEHTTDRWEVADGRLTFWRAGGTEDA